MSNEPDIIRQDTPHQVTVTDGSQVAAAKSLDPNAPQVRRNLVGQDADASEAQSADFELPPPLAASSPAPAAPVFERQAGAPPAPAMQAPEAAHAPAAEPGLVFERAIHDAIGAADVPPAAAPAPGEAPVLTRAIEDRFEPVPPEALTAAPAEADAQGLALTDRRLQADDLPPPPPQSGPVLSRELPPDVQATAAKAPPLPDNWQKLPPAEARPLAEAELPAAQPPAEPAVPAVPTAQAQAELMETARQAQAQIEETLGPADPQWVEMDFPARVIRLKIENDKVRSRLDQLEALNHPTRR